MCVAYATKKKPKDGLINETFEQVAWPQENKVVKIEMKLISSLFGVKLIFLIYKFMFIMDRCI